MNEKAMKTAHTEALSKVRHELPADVLAQLLAVADLPEEAINTADLPEARDWSHAVRGRFASPAQRQLTLSIDADVDDYFRAQAGGGEYQTLINRALRAAMLRSLRRRQHGGAA